MKVIVLTILSVIILLLISEGTIAQAKLVLNDGIIDITDDAILVIDNPAKMTITHKVSAYI